VNTITRAVFLSYASQDAEAARRICDALRAVGLDVWFDQSALRGGDAWDASIRRQIKECALFVPVISANTRAREEGYFRREWNLAVIRTLDMADDKAFLLPVVIDATVDANARVPEKFREVQWTHLPEGAALDLNSKAGVVHSVLSNIRLKQGHPEAALAEASLEPHPVLRLTYTAMARHALGDAAGTDAALSELIADHTQIAAYDIAQVRAQRGEIDRAFEWLERGYLQRDSGMPLLVNDRFLKPLHDDPRWGPLLRKVGVAE